MTYVDVRDDPAARAEGEKAVKQIESTHPEYIDEQRRARLAEGVERYEARFVDVSQSLYAARETQIQEAGRIRTGERKTILRRTDAPYIIDAFGEPEKAIAETAQESIEAAKKRTHTETKAEGALIYTGAQATVAVAGIFEGVTALARPYNIPRGISQAAETVRDPTKFQEAIASFQADPLKTFIAVPSAYIGGATVQRAASGIVKRAQVVYRRRQFDAAGGLEAQTKFDQPFDFPEETVQQRDTFRGFEKQKITISDPKKPDGIGVSMDLEYATLIDDVPPQPPIDVKGSMDPWKPAQVYDAVDELTIIKGGKGTALMQDTVKGGMKPLLPSELEAAKTVVVELKEMKLETVVNPIKAVETRTYYKPRVPTDYDYGIVTMRGKTIPGTVELGAILSLTDITPKATIKPASLDLIQRLPLDLGIGLKDVTTPIDDTKQDPTTDQKPKTYQVIDHFYENVPYVPPVQIVETVPVVVPKTRQRQTPITIPAPPIIPPGQEPQYREPRPPPVKTRKKKKKKKKKELDPLSLETAAELRVTPIKLKDLLKI